jgi:signal transduction histidine kinase
MLRPTAGKYNTEIVLNLPENLPPANGVTEELTRVVWNVFDNALRHTTNGTITVTGKASSKYVHVSIADTGSGMTPEAKSMAFERGYSGSVRSGLGLAFCREIVVAYGGEIEIQSELGEGCTVSFSLPVYGGLE